MIKQKQKRTLATHAKLLSCARYVVAEKGYGALRVEEVVTQAGVAKGTFFAHFRDKDALMDMLIGEEIDRYLDDLEVLQGPESVEGLLALMQPLLQFMTRERYIFEVIMRHTGAADPEGVNPISDTFTRQIGVLVPWVASGPFRSDVEPVLLAEGIQAFAMQSMALHFCAVHNATSFETRLLNYLKAWLLSPPSN